MKKQEFLTIGKVAKMFGLSVQTIRRWEKKGELKAIRSLGNHRLFPVEEVRRLAENNQPRKAVIYARVSSSKQKTDGNLKRQVDRLQTYADENSYEVVQIFQEEESGINENREQLEQLIRMAENKEFSVLLIEYPDRLARFGFFYLERLFQICGIEILSTQKREFRSSQEELTEDFLTMTTVFSERIYGQCSQLFQQKVKETMREIGGEQDGEEHKDATTGDSSRCE